MSRSYPAQWNAAEETVLINSEWFMRHLLPKQVIVLISLMIVQSSVAQTTQTSGQQNKKEKSSIVPMKDLNANRIDDAKENLRSGKTTTVKTHDQFIDTNGDGICDNREQGLGFRRGKMDTGKQTGKRQQGRQK
jgi:hypothetical protein